MGGIPGGIDPGGNPAGGIAPGGPGNPINHTMYISMMKYYMKF